MIGDAFLPFEETVSESNMEGVAASVEPASHRSLFVPGELHLGPVGKCPKCAPYTREGDHGAAY